jgi:cation:H+ antiporter
VSSAVSVALLIGGIVLVVAGAELFFEGLLAGAARLGVSAFALTALVSGFELENLAAGIAANAKGLPNAAAGTFLGGTTFLALGVAGLGALISPLQARLPSTVLGWTAWAPAPLLALGLDGELSRLDGGVLVGFFAVAMLALWHFGAVVLGGEPLARKRFVLARILAGLALLTVAGELLGEGLRRVVSRFGVSETLLGNTAVAASVEAEEVARVAAPARRGRADVALGNIIGTIVHFVGFNAGVIALVKPIELGSASRWLHLPVAAVSPLLLAGLLAWRGGLGRFAGGVLLALYACYVAAAVVAALG